MSHEELKTDDQLLDLYVFYYVRKGLSYQRAVKEIKRIFKKHGYRKVDNACEK